MPIIALLAGLLALSGGVVAVSQVSGDDSGKSSSGIPVAVGESATVAVPAVSTAADISREAAIARALDRVSGVVGRVEKDTEEGVVVWKVRITGAEGVVDVEVRADNGEIFRVRSENRNGRSVSDDDDTDESFSSSDDVAGASIEVTREEAVAIGLARFGGSIVKSELEREDGRIVWNIRIVSADGSTRADVRIDAVTGDILRFRTKSLVSDDDSVSGNSGKGGDDDRDDDRKHRSGDDDGDGGSDDDGSDDSDGDDRSEGGKSGGDSRDPDDRD